jgi:hypothetical protein
MNANQIKKVRAMLYKAGLMNYKDEIVLSHTDGRTNSLTAMEQDETESIIKYLEGANKQPPSPAEKMRNKILSIGHEMKWHLKGTRKVDIVRIDNWCLAKFKYTLDDLPYLDLCSAVTAFEMVLKSYLKGI